MTGSWICSASDSLPIDKDSAWDGPAAESSIFDWASNNDGIIAAKAKRAFLAYDESEPTLKGSYKLPIGKVFDGKLTAVASGLRAAASRLPQTDIPASVREDARDVLDKYFKKLGDDSEEDSRSSILLTRMEIRKATAYDPNEPLPEGIMRQVWDPGVLDDGPPFLFTVAASTGQVDSYHTRMMPSSLRNFADDATKGISLCNSHNTDELPFGRTYDGRYVAGGQGGHASARAEMDVFMPRGMSVNGVDTDHVIRGIRWGVGRDVSVGFYGGKTRCSLCGKDMGGDLFSLLMFGFPDGEESNDPDAPCWHLPGMDYKMTDRKGDPTGEVKKAVGEIDGAHCAEVSLVFDGATPGAAVINGRRCVAIAKAERMAHIGVLGRQAATHLLGQYRNVRSAAIEDVVRKRYAGVLLSAPRTPVVNVEIQPSESLEHHDTNEDGQTRDVVADVVYATASLSPLVTTTATNTSGITITANYDGTNAYQSTITSGAITSAVNEEEAPVMTKPNSGGVTPSEQETPLEQRATAVQTPAPPELDSAQEVEQPVETTAGVIQSAPASPPTDETPAVDTRSTVDPKVSKKASALLDTRAPAPTEETREGLNQHARRTAHDEIRLALVSARLLPEDFTGDLVQGIRELGPEVDRLRGWATVGQSARGELVENIREEGIRALGSDGLPPEVYDPILKNGSWSQLIGLRDHMRKQAAQRFVPGRASQEEETPLETPKPKSEPAFVGSEVPDYVYRVRN